MSDFIGDRECVTHHYACDCREAEIEGLMKRLIQAVEASDDAHYYDQLLMEARGFVGWQGPSSLVPTGRIVLRAPSPSDPQRDSDA